MNQHITAGGSSPATSFNAINTSPIASPRQLNPAVQIAILFAVGAIAFILQKSFRWPIQMPGHQGIQWLAILVTARLFSTTSAAGLMTGIGAAAAALWYAGAVGVDNKTAQMLIFVLQGAILDVLFAFFQKAPLRMIWIPLAGALVHTIAPLVRNAFLSMSSGLLDFASLIHGIGYPLMMHAMFGATGAALGLALYTACRKKKPVN